MVQRVFAAADIQGVAVRQEGLAALTFYQIRHGFGPVGAEIGHVARLTEVELDGDEFVLEVDLLKAGGLHEAAQLFERADLVRVQIGKIYFCRFHRKHLRSLISFSFPGGTDPPSLILLCLPNAVNRKKRRTPAGIRRCVRAEPCPRRRRPDADTGICSSSGLTVSTVGEEIGRDRKSRMKEGQKIHALVIDR